MRKITLVLVLLCLGTANSPGWAAQVDRISITKDGKYYVTEAEFLISVPRPQVFQAFTEFDNLPVLNPAVIHSSAKPLSQDTSRVTTRVKDCVGVFCRSLTLVEDVTIDPKGIVNSIMVEGLSDFTAGQTTWQFDAYGDKTRVRYSSRVRPGFWLPPLVGKRAMRKALTRQIITAV